MTLPFVVFFIGVVFLSVSPTRLLPSLNLVAEPFDQPNRHRQFLTCPLTITSRHFVRRTGAEVGRAEPQEHDRAAAEQRRLDVLAPISALMAPLRWIAINLLFTSVF
jgi:hypothetical protein